MWPGLRRFLQVEQGVVFVGVLVSALFAVVRPGAPILFMAVCILNLMYFLQAGAGRLQANRSFPWNWAIYLPILATGSLLGALAAVALLQLMMPNIQPYWSLFRETWKMVVVVSMGIGIAGYAVQQLQRKLQEKNKLLEQVVERGSVALQQQEQELNRAREIQTGLLPKILPQIPGVELAGAWQPARAVGGDYFDVIRLDERRLGICIGDVSGKGITAALLMANLQAAFRAYATPEAKPSEVCSKLNEFVCGNVAPGKFITFFYAILNAGDRTLVYENAGHCAGLLLKRNGLGATARAGRCAGRTAGVDLCGLHRNSFTRGPIAVFHGRRHRSGKPRGGRVRLRRDLQGGRKRSQFSGRTQKQGYEGSCGVLPRGIP